MKLQLFKTGDTWINIHRIEAWQKEQYCSQENKEKINKTSMYQMY
jgi:hypothetical protein